MKHPWYARVLSLALTLVMVFELLPANIWAVDAETETLSQSQEELPEEPAVIVGEVEELRSENEKHYRLSDGSFVAVNYGMPVHYAQGDGEHAVWMDIDNTLSAAAAQMDRESAPAYTATNGSEVKSFASVFTPDGYLFSSRMGAYEVSMSLMQEATAHQLLAAAKPTEERQPEERESAVQEATVPVETTLPTEDTSDSEVSLPGEETTPDPGTEVQEASADDGTQPETGASGLPEEEEQETTAPTAPAEDPLAQETEPTAPGETALPGRNADHAEETLDSPVPETVPVETPSASLLRESQAQVINPDSEIMPLSLDGPEETEISERVALPRLSSTVIYPDILPGVDLRYDTMGFHIKESIVVNETQPSYTYRFLLNLEGLTPEAQEDGAILLRDGEGRTIYRMPAPYMVDAAGTVSYGVTYSLDPVAAGCLLTVEADSAWMDDPSRAYPVAIDPTLVLHAFTGAEDIYATFVEQGSPNESYGGRQDLYFGYTDYLGARERQIYMHFNRLPELPQGSVMVNATLYLWQMAYSDVDYPEMVVQAHEVTGSKPSSSSSYYSWMYNLTWNTRPAYSANIVDYAIASGTVDNSYRTWDLTALVNKWYTTGTENRTIALTAPDPDSYSSGRYAVPVFYAYKENHPPMLLISYRNNTGLEDYYTYRAFSAGEAGTVYLSDFSSQITIAREICSLASGANPVSLEMVFNSAYFSRQTDSQYDVCKELGMDMHIGSGWTYNLLRHVRKETIGQVVYLRYLDGDGTLHYFSKKAEDDGYYYDEDGLGLKIQDQTGDRYLLSDGKGNTMTFVNGLLTRISDESGNQILIRYASGDPKGSNDRITKIVQKNNGGSERTVASFAYKSHNPYNGTVANYVDTITDYAGNVYKFDYQNGKLHTITRNGTRIAEYTMALSGGAYQNQIDAIKDCGTGYTLKLSYHNHAVSKIQEQAGDTGGATLEVSRGDRQTTYRDYGANRTKDTTDDLFTTYSFDYSGRTVNASTTDSGGNLVGATNAVYTANSGSDRGRAVNNRMTRTASIGAAARNLAAYSGFESSSGWTIYNVGSAEDGYAAAITGTGKTRTGAKAFKTWVKSGVTQTVGIYRTSYALTKGKTYTLSAWVNTTEADTSALASGGIVLKVKRGGEEYLAEGLVNYKTDSGINGGWERVSLTFTPQVSATYEIGVYDRSMPGNVYIDDLQLEEGEAPSTHNLLENGSFTQGTTGWSRGNASAVTTASGGRSGNALKVTGSPTAEDRNATQTVPLNQPGSQTYVLSGWARANSVPDNVTTASDAASDKHKQFGLRAIVTYSDGAKEYHYAPFNPDLTDWQFTSLTIVPKSAGKTVSGIQVVCAYERNANTAYFDDLSLTREAAQTMKYDAGGNLVSVTTSGLKEDANTYSGGNLIKTVTGGNGTFTYNYDKTYAHRLTSVSDGHVTQSLSYDSVGNVTGTSLTGGSLTMKTSATYLNDGNLTASVTGASGEKTTYAYATTQSQMLGAPTSVTNALGTTVQNTYDSFGRITKNAIANSATLAYTYANGNLASVERTGAVAGAQEYRFAYDAFGSRTAIQVGSHTLGRYTYGPGSGSLTSQTYGNGDTVSFTYDTLGRVKTTTYSGGRTLSYTYNGEGQLASMTDSTGNTDTYQYDSLGRLVGSGQSASGSRASYTYDSSGRMTGRDFSYPGLTTAAERYYYNTATSDSIPDGLLTSMSMVDWRKINLSYDSLERLTSRDIAGTVTQSYTYAAGSASGTTSTRIATYESKYNGTSAAKYQYAYDAAGNITRQTNKLDNSYWAYAYDVQGELQYATSYAANGTASARYKYYYDAAGNLKSWQVTNDDNSQTLESHTYTYGDPDWKDLLTAFDGQSITYDGAGNPLSYYDGSTMKWTEGRRLQSVTKGGKTTTYQYDASGQRTRKTNPDGSYTKYCVVDGRVIGEIVYKKTANGVKWSHGVRYIYGDDGSVIGFGIWDADTQDEWERYYFVKNVQGDVQKVYRVADNKLVASYEYDPYGRVLSATGEMAGENPFRYRGYYYDSETGFYYLQSRYYDPQTCRFINADDTSNLAANGDVVSFNLFAYCGNNPIMGYDPTGEWDWGTFFNGAGLLATGVMAVAAAATVLTCGAAAPVMVAVAAVTASAGALTVVNGAAEVAESVTGYNVVRDGAFQGNAAAYNTYRYSTKMVAEVGTMICGAYHSAKGGNVCFVAGTLVQTGDGAKPIEEIQPGDMVWAWDEETGDVALKPVVETYVNETDELIHLSVNGAEIVCTPSHPFYSPVKGWTDAVHLRAGDILVLVNGECAVVEKIQHELLESPVKVYNFQVEDYHTYYVSDSGVLVHNMCAKKASSSAMSAKDFIKSPKNAKEVVKFLEKRGFEKVSQEGSHIKMVNEIYTTIIPNHGKKEITIGTLRSIMKQAGLM